MSAPSTSGETVPHCRFESMRRVQQLRRNRDFNLLQGGQALSTLGSETSAIAYPLLVLALTHSPAKAGVVGFARLLPYTLFVLPAGVVVDRVDRKRLMLVSDLVRALAMASLVIALVADRLSFAQIVLVAFVEGAMYSFFNIAELGALRSVVPRADLPRAAAVEQARIGGVVLAGPPLGGFLFGISRSLPFLVDAISYVFSFLTLVAMRTPFQEERVSPAPSVRSALVEGFTWLWRQPFLRTCALLFACSNFVWSALFLVLIVAGQRQGLDPGAIGVLIAGLGGLVFLGALVSQWLQRAISMRAIVVVPFWLSLGIGAFLAVPNVYVLLAGIAPSAFLLPTSNAAVVGYRVAVIPDQLQGRVNSVARLLAQIAAPLGPLAAGVLLASLSARLTVVFLLAFAAVIALAATFSRAIRNAPALADLGDANRPLGEDGSGFTPTASPLD